MIFARENENANGCGIPVFDAASKIELVFSCKIMPVSVLLFSEIITGTTRATRASV